MVTVLHLCHGSVIAVYGQGYTQGHGQAAASSLRIGLLVVTYRIPSKHLGFHCYSSSGEDPYPANIFFKGRRCLFCGLRPDGRSCSRAVRPRGAVEGRNRAIRQSGFIRLTSGASPALQCNVPGRNAETPGPTVPNFFACRPQNFANSWISSSFTPSTRRASNAGLQNGDDYRVPCRGSLSGPTPYLCHRGGCAAASMLNLH